MLITREMNMLVARATNVGVLKKKIFHLKRNRLRLASYKSILSLCTWETIEKRREEKYDYLEVMNTHSFKIIPKGNDTEI